MPVTLIRNGMPHTEPVRPVTSQQRACHQSTQRSLTPCRLPTATAAAALALVRPCRREPGLDTVVSPPCSTREPPNTSYDTQWLVSCPPPLLPLAPAAHSSPQQDNLENIPGSLSTTGESRQPLLSKLFNSNKDVGGCVKKCVATCIRGGASKAGGGSPGLGPLSMRQEVVVFKDEFRSRQYCVSECTQVCALKPNS